MEPEGIDLAALSRLHTHMIYLERGAGTTELSQGGLQVQVGTREYRLGLFRLGAAGFKMATSSFLELPPPHQYCSSSSRGALSVDS